MRLMIFALIALGAFAFVSFQLMSFGKFMRYRSKDTESDELDLIDRLRDLRKQLVPMTAAEIENLSLRKSHREHIDGRVATVIGLYESIYHEPLLAFGYMDYDGGSNALLVAQSMTDTWIYKIQGRHTEVHINDRMVGRIEQDGRLTGAETRRTLASIDLMGRNNYPVSVGEKEVGHVVSLSAASTVNPRAVQLYAQMEQDEQELFLALAILSMVQSELA